MKVQISSDGKKKLMLEGETIGLRAPADGAPLMIEAEIDEGSPIQIVVGTLGAPMPIRRLQIVHSGTYRVKGFDRRTKAGIVHIAGHVRRKPYRTLRAKHKSI